MSEPSPTASRPRIAATLRETESVTPLELFFDLVFVLALTQCTALMAADPSWEGVGQGMLILTLLWWAWVGYAWLTSVVDPEEGAVRFAIFAAMAAMLIVSLAVPEAFAELGLLFACAYAVVRLMQIALFSIASSGDPALRRSVVGLGISTVIGVGLLVGASAADGALQASLWALAIVVDLGGPALFGTDGWKLMPEHFAERHGLIMIIALGESIVAIGVGSQAGLGTVEVLAAVAGIGVACALWWLYFDVVALVAALRLGRAEVGREQNALARDCYSFMHLPMIAGIVLGALGLKKTLEHASDPLELVPAFALLGGTALYLLGHVGFRWRSIHRLSAGRIVAAAVLVALIPLATEVASTLSVAMVLAVLAVLVAYEVVRFAELRDRMRHQLAEGTPSA